MIIRDISLRQQIRSLRQQLHIIQNTNMDRKVSIQLLNKDIEGLAMEINNILHTSKALKIKSIQKENELKDMIAGMSHDLRTPLTSIMGYVQLLDNANLTQIEKDRYIAITKQRSQALRGLLNDFYELSLIDSSDYRLMLEKINYSRLLEDMVLGKYTEFYDRGLEPTIHIDGNIIVLCDRQALERIIENLLSNMIKYAITRTNITLGEEEQYIHLTVSNDCKDINRLDIDRLFDRFYKGDRARGKQGTGLGLAIVKGLVERMDGQVYGEKKNDELLLHCLLPKY